MKILLLEDDPLLNEIIEEFLLSLNFDVICCYNGDEAHEKTYETLFDLLILDVNVPNINGFELLKELRQNKIQTPAIFITSLDSMKDVQEGFNSGCDDYIKKPFELKELELRINNIKKHFNIKQESLTIDHNLQFYPMELQLDNQGIKTQLAKKEAQILQYFINNPQKTISYDELISNIWAYEDSPTLSTIRTYIKNLRKLLGEDYIQTIKGVGYRFNV